MNERFKAYPPRWRHVLVPTSSKKAALSGLMLYSPCRPKALAAHRAVHTLVRAVGPVAIPGHTVSWANPLPQRTWQDFIEKTSKQLGCITSLAIYSPPQPWRKAFSVLLLGDVSPLAFATFREGGSERFEHERRAIELMESLRPRQFRLPHPLVVDNVDGWSYILFEPLPLGLHRPVVNPPLDAIVAEIQEGLALLPKPESTPGHWVPFHGDLTPWNLRATGDGTQFLIDWESAGWGPPGVDAVLYRAAELKLFGGLAEAFPQEAIDYWLEVYRNRKRDKSDGVLTMKDAIAQLAQKSTG